MQQPDSVLSPNQAFAKFAYIYYNMGNELVGTDPWSGMLVKRDMNTVLESIALGLCDELGLAFDAYFGSDTDDWREMNLRQVMRQVVARAASRFTVGLPLCRNEEYLDLSFRAVDTFVTHPAIASHSPRVLLPIVGRLSGLQTKFLERKIRKLFAPTFHERMRWLTGDVAGKGGQHHLKEEEQEPLDHIQLMLRYAARERPQELTLEWITKRLLVGNVGSYHQTALQATNLLLDILASDAEFHTVALLRDEAVRVIGEDYRGGGTWTRANAARMVRADSTMRETLRRRSFGRRSLQRLVVAEGGVVTDGGVALPEGAMVSVLGGPAQLDGDAYDEPMGFDPFRFSRPREAAAAAAAAAAADEEKEAKEEGRRGGPPVAATTFVSTGPDYLPFGHGNYACPGRFLVDFEMKMIITYLLMHYDIKFPDSYGGKRPDNVFAAELEFPPDDAVITVRRRKSVGVA